MKGKLIKTEVNYILEDDKGVVIASTSLKKEGLSLSLKNCQAIERGYDLDELAYEITNKEHLLATQYSKGYEKGIIVGFQKALELMSDKKFSEDTVINAYHKGFFSEKLTTNEWVKEVNSHIQSLQQTEWDVEIEMEFVEEEQTGTHLVWGRATPKLDAENCLILKRL